MPMRSVALTSLTPGNQQHSKVAKNAAMILQIKDVPSEAACSALEQRQQKQREAAIAAATKLKTLRRRNNPTSCRNSFTTCAFLV